VDFSAVGYDYYYRYSRGYGYGYGEHPYARPEANKQDI